MSMLSCKSRSGPYNRGCAPVCAGDVYKRQKQESPSPQAVPAAGEPTISMTALLELLKNADSEVKAQLLSLIHI